MRLDIEETSLDTIYVTVWASPYLPLHMGKVENADKMFQDHFGRQLQVFSMFILIDYIFSNSLQVKVTSYSFDSQVLIIHWTLPFPLL